MKHVIILLITLSVPAILRSQNLPEQNCNGAIPVCQPVYQQANSYVGEGSLSELSTVNQDCLLSGENNTVWYIINVTSPGILEFVITPNSPTDYDFAVWNATGLGCAAVASTLPVRCNYSGQHGPTGLSPTSTITSATAADPPFSAAINALAGETYILVVDNFSSSQFGYALDFSASTASIYDTIKPFFQSAGSHCGTVSNTISVTMSEPVTCASLAANGSDFHITPVIPGVSGVVAASSVNCTGSAQFTNGFTLQFAGTLPPGTYWLHPKAGSDGNSLLDNCGNEQSYTDSIAFVMVAGNPPQMVRLDTPACIRARLILDRPIACATVAVNGSDFQVSGPSPVSVVSAAPVSCNAANMTDTIDLVFDQSVRVAGSYTLSVKAGTDGNSLVDTCGVSVLNTITWEVSDKGVEASVSPDLLCDPGYVQLTASTLLQPSPEGYRYVWAPSQYISDSTAGSTLAYVSQSTTYYVRMTDENYCYRRDTTSVILSVRNPVMEPLADPEICIGDQVTLNASGGLHYVWFPAEGLSCTDCTHPVAAPLETTTYSVAIRDMHECADTLSQTVIVHPLPAVDAGPDKTILFGQQVQLAAGATGIIYLWEPAKGLDYVTVPGPIAAPQENTTYYVTVIDANECRNSDSVRVFVRSDIPVIIPSAFTPNGDGRNDQFGVRNVSFHKLQEFRVFNRWGQEVFHTTDPANSWDGSFRSVPQESGVYHYLIRVSYPDGRVETFKGDVTLVR